MGEFRFFDFGTVGVSLGISNFHFNIYARSLGPPAYRCQAQTPQMSTLFISKDQGTTGLVVEISHKIAYRRTRSFRPGIDEAFVILSSSTNSAYCVASGLESPSRAYSNSELDMNMRVPSMSFRLKTKSLRAPNYLHVLDLKLLRPAIASRDVE